ncbi:glycerol-3-phosphate phosphatase-like protein [Calycina marina]|uniref:Glycerol-3-phosphate phosphatase-like protein n=1 Tax=Calycina marina TaxID=1763456 RepID=A0A9P8CIZ3_9HELO|nr:glycerol-3-phosphate phosphatase-like protein [Calycina marina]
MASSNPDYSLPPQKLIFKGLLFDMDGTIIDSTSAVEKHWGTIGAELGVDPKVILQTSHGRRSIDVLRILSPEKANWPYIKYMEGQLPILYGDDAVEIPGARAVLDAVTKHSVPWVIVTSGTSLLVGGWLKVLKLPIPEHLVVAEDVENGKPDPTCYLMGKKKLGLRADDATLVFEDSPAGIAAGKAAGCKVLGVVTSHTVEQIIAAEPDWVVQDLRSFSIIGHSEDGIEVEISNALEVRK